MHADLLNRTAPQSRPSNPHGECQIMPTATKGRSMYRITKLYRSCILPIVGKHQDYHSFTALVTRSIIHTRFIPHFPEFTLFIR